LSHNFRNVVGSFNKIILLWFWFDYFFLLFSNDWLSFWLFFFRFRFFLFYFWLDFLFNLWLDFLFNFGLNFLFNFWFRFFLNFFFRFLAFSFPLIAILFHLVSKFLKLFSASTKASFTLFLVSLSMTTQKSSQKIDSFSNAWERNSLSINLKSFILIINNSENFHWCVFNFLYL
jgi:hypothetical protein